MENNRRLNSVKRKKYKFRGYGFLKIYILALEFHQIL